MCLFLATKCRVASFPPLPWVYPDCLWLQVLEAYEKLEETDPKYETSEVIMYKNVIIEEMGNYEGALAHLEQNWDEVLSPCHHAPSHFCCACHLYLCAPSHT